MSDKFDEFDDFDNFDLPDFDDESMGGVPMDRSPVDRATNGLMEGMGNTLRDPSTYKQMIKKGMPEGYDKALTKSSDYFSATSDLYDTAKEELEPAKKNLKKIAGFGADKLEGILPKGLIDKLRDVSKIDVNTSYDPEQMEIDATMASIFGDSAAQAAVASEATAVQHEESKVLANESNAYQSSMARDIRKISDYNENIGLKVQRKALELQYKQYFTSQRQFTLLESYAKESSMNFKEIVKNTALPDFVKMRSAEVVEFQIKQKVIGSLAGKVGDNVRGRLNAFKENGVKKLRSLGADVRSKIEGVTETIDMMKEAEEAGIDKTAMQASIVGGMATSSVLNEVMKRVAVYTKGNKTVEKYGEMASYYSANSDQIALDKLSRVGKKFGVYVGDREVISQKDLLTGKFIDKNTRLPIKKLKDITGEVVTIDGQTVITQEEYDNGLSSGADSKYEKVINAGREFVADMIPRYKSTFTTDRDPVKMRYMAGLYSEASDLTLTEVIPDVLSMIHAEVKTIRMNSSTLVPKERYNWTTGKHEDVSKVVDNLKEEIMPLNTLKSMTSDFKDFIEIIDPDNLLSKKAKSELIRAVIKDVSDGNGFFGFDRYLNMALSSDPKIDDELKTHIAKSHSYDTDDDSIAAYKLQNKLSDKFRAMTNVMPAWQDKTQEMQAVYGLDIMNQSGFMKKLKSNNEYATSKLMEIFSAGDGTNATPDAMSNITDKIEREIDSFREMGADDEFIRNNIKNSYPHYIGIDDYLSGGKNDTRIGSSSSDELLRVFKVKFGYDTNPDTSISQDIMKIHSGLYYERGVTVVDKLDRIIDILSGNKGPSGPSGGPGGSDSPTGGGLSATLTTKRRPLKRKARIRINGDGVPVDDSLSVGGDPISADRIGFTSDEDSKDNLKDIAKGNLAKRFYDNSKLKMATWKSKITGKMDHGTTAQSLAKINPDLINDKDDTGNKYHTVNLKELVTHLTESMSGASNEVADVKEKVARLMGSEGFGHVKSTMDNVKNKSDEAMSKFEDLKLNLGSRIESTSIKNNVSGSIQELLDTIKESDALKDGGDTISKVRNKIKGTKDKVLSSVKFNNVNNANAVLIRDMYDEYGNAEFSDDGASNEIVRAIHIQTDILKSAIDNGSLMGFGLGSGSIDPKAINDVKDHLKSKFKEVKGSGLVSTILGKLQKGYGYVGDKLLKGAGFGAATTGGFAESISRGIGLMKRDVTSSISLLGDPRKLISARDFELGNFKDSITGKIIRSVEDLQNAKGDIVSVLNPDDVIVKWTDISSGKLLIDNVSRLKFNTEGISKSLESIRGFVGRGVSGSFGVYGNILNKLSDRVDGMQDIYLEGKGDTPILSAINFRLGYYRDKDGNPITKLSDINGDLFDPDGNIVLALKDLHQRKLYFKDGRVVKFAKTTMDAILNLGGFLKRGMGHAYKVYKGVGSWALNKLRGKFKNTGDPVIAGQSIIVDQLSKIYDLLDDRMEDQTADYKNSYMNRNKKTSVNKRFSSSKLNTGGIAGALGLAGAAEEGDSGDTNINIGGGGDDDKKSKKPTRKPKGKLGKALQFGKKWAGRGLSTGARLLGLSSIMSMVPSMGAIAGGLSAAGSTLATGATWLATGASALLSAPVLITAGVVAGLAVGGYYAYKYFTNTVNGPLHELRLMQYGIDPNNSDMRGAITKLEDMLMNHVKSGPNGITLDAKIDDGEVLSIMGIDTDNSEEVYNFTNWFVNRFKPVFVNAIAAYKHIKGDMKLNNISDFNDKQSLEYVKIVSKLDKSVYSITTSPSPDYMESLYSYDTINSKIKSLLNIFKVSTSADKPAMDITETQGAERAKAMAIAVNNELSNSKKDIPDVKMNIRDGLGNSKDLNRQSLSDRVYENDPTASILNASYLVQVNMDRTLSEIRDHLIKGKKRERKEKNISLMDRASKFFSGDENSDISDMAFDTDTYTSPK